MVSESLPRDPEAPKRTRDFIDRVGAILDDLIRAGDVYRSGTGWAIRQSSSGASQPASADSMWNLDEPDDSWQMPWPIPDPVLFSVSLTHSVDQTANNATQTFLEFDTERFDPHGYHSTISNTTRITIPDGMGGQYLFAALARWSPDGLGDRTLVVLLNGFEPLAVQTIVPVASGANTDQLIISAPVTLIAGDYVELYVNQSSGSSLTIVKQGSFSPNFGCVRISR